MLCRLERTNEQTNVIPGCERLLFPEHFHSSTQLPTLIRWIPRTFYDKRQIVFILFYPRIFTKSASTSSHRPPTSTSVVDLHPLDNSRFNSQVGAFTFMHTISIEALYEQRTNESSTLTRISWTPPWTKHSPCLPAKHLPILPFCFENAKPTPPLGKPHSSTSLHSSVVHTRGLLQPECCIECHLLRTTSPLLLLVTNK